MGRTVNIIIKGTIHIFVSIGKIKRILLMGRRNRERWVLSDCAITWVPRMTALRRANVGNDVIFFSSFFFLHLIFTFYLNTDASVVDFSLLLYFNKNGDHPASQTPPFLHCLHVRNLDFDLDYLFIFRCKHSQLPVAQCHVNMACNQRLETWDVAIIYTGGQGSVSLFNGCQLTAWHCPQQN